MAPAIPAIEPADNADPERVGCPDDKVDPGDPVYRSQMRPQRIVRFEESAFRKEMQIVLTDQGGKRIGVVVVRGRAVGIGDLDAVGHRSL